MKVEIKTAKSAGFCFGVSRAAETAFGMAKRGEKAVTLGELIHNPSVVNDLAEKGIRAVDSLDGLSGDETVIIRSHGVPKSVYDQLDNKGLRYVDCTCPFVERIHKIAAEKSREGCDIIIMGDKDHPEVVGISGFCENMPYIFKTFDEFSLFLKNNHKNLKKTLAIMAQTTYNISMWEKCTQLVRHMQECGELTGEVFVFNTICSATANRQAEAAMLAKSADLMIVIGGRRSSNTLKLFNICSGLCSSCLLIESADEIDPCEMRKLIPLDADTIFTIGITAGASTPAYIIKEVQRLMSEIVKNLDEDINFEEALEASFKKIYTGNRVKGYIVAVNNSEAVVDVGTKHTGYAPLSELTDDPTLKPSDVVSVGDSVDFIVTKVNDQDGVVYLSKKKLDARAGFEAILKAKEDGTILDGVVTNVVKGGVLVLSNGAKVFIPASQATARRDEPLEGLLKKNVKFKIIDVNEQREKAVGSIRAVLNAEKDAAKAKFWENVKVGDVFKGEVKSITNYGAFVDLGGIDGMVHISELSWNRIKHPSEVVKVGDVLEVFVKDLDQEANRISLGYKKDSDNPWEKFKSEYNVDDVVKAKVVSITPFGAFAQIIPGIDGLIHISQIADKRVTNVKDVLEIGQEVEAKITEIDIDKKRISMSMRALLDGSEEASEE